MADSQIAQRADAINSQKQTIIQKNFVFKPNVDLVLLNKFRQEEKHYKEDLINKSFQKEYYQQSTLRKLLPYLQQWKNYTNLSLQNRNCSFLLKQLSTFHFTNLIYLYLGNNNINNVQSVASLDAPNLIKLYLYHNQIRSFKALHKTKFPKLFRVSLYDNKCSQLQRFEDILWDPKQIQWISLEDTNISYITYDHVKVLKINSILKQLWINSNFRITNKALQMFDKKFNGKPNMMHYPQNKNK